MFTAAHDFDLLISLTTPFSYDPARGDLLLDVVVVGASGSGSTAGFIFDVDSGTAAMGRLRSDGNIVLGTPNEGLALEYAELVTRDANHVPDEFFARLREAFSDPEIVELTFMIGLITMLNRFNNALQIRYGEEYREVRVS